MADAVVPAGSTVVVRGYPEHDDQVREVGRALAARGVSMAVLVDDLRPPSPPLDFDCRILGSRTPAAALAYLRAPVVVHTHGVYGNVGRGPRTRFVNLWHGMPIKRLPAGSDVGHHQTDLTVATSDYHARHLAETWDLELDQVAVVGLPRNDVLRRDLPDRVVDSLAAAGLRRPFALWMPTFRSSISKHGERDGIDRDTVTQFEGADLARVGELAEELELDVLVKPHPLAPPTREEPESDRVHVWIEDDVRAAGITAYELIAASELLITDVSSVWIDHLILDHPIYFAFSDRDQYGATRGFYFDGDDEWPGPISATWDELAGHLRDRVAERPEWVARRAEARALHHAPIDQPSAEVVADRIVAMLP